MYKVHKHRVMPVHTHRFDELNFASILFLKLITNTKGNLQVLIEFRKVLLLS